MLKFSGFAHLTSCHERICTSRSEARLSVQQTRQQLTHKVLIKLLVEHKAHTLHASRAQNTLMHRHAYCQRHARNA